MKVVYIVAIYHMRLISLHLEIYSSKYD